MDHIIWSIRRKEGGMAGSDKEESINVTAFKARCLAVIDAVAQGKTTRVVLTRRDRPVAALVPYTQAMTPLWGALRGTVTMLPGTDLTAPTGEAWDANA
jgi:antitoxin (DNA-binding transcriptional repressor) of toxin-antitoxin stability system